MMLLILKWGLSSAVFCKVLEGMGYRNEIGSLGQSSSGEHNCDQDTQD